MENRYKSDIAFTVKSPIFEQFNVKSIGHLMIMQSKKIHLIFLFLLITALSYGQKKNSDSKPLSDKALLKESFEDAEFFFEQEDYKEALFNFQKVSEKMPENANILFRIGMCYVNINGEETKAIPYFEKAAPKISAKYNRSVFEETKAPLYLLFYLGNAYRINNQLTKALDTYNKFRNNPNFDGNYNAGMVENEIAACERAKLIQDNPVELNVANLGTLINNPNSNRRPVVNEDETTLIYLSALKFYDAIYYSKKVNGEWSEPENISAQVGSDGDCEPACLSADGNDLYLIKKKKGNNDIFVSHLKDGLWTQMVALNKNINSSRNESAASISADGLCLYFSSDRRGGEGNLDIYKAERKAGGDWESAKNLGKTINTEQNDNMPFISKDGKTLYLSSEGHLNMGGYDIFISTLNSDGKWETVANAGYPVNTTGNDLYWLPLKNGEIAYTSLIKADGQGQDDIYRIENKTVESRNQNALNNIQPYKVIVRNKLNNDIVGVLLYDKNPDSLKFEKSSEYIEVKIKN